MKKFISRIKEKWLSCLQLSRCGYVMIWRSAAVLLQYRCHRLTRAKVNRHFRRGSLRLLALARANYQVKFDPQFSLQPKVPYVFMSNHLSLFDLPFILAVMPGTIRLIAKQQLFRIPLFGDAVAAAELLPADNDHPAAMQHLFTTARQKLVEGVMLWIFPEGKRSSSGELLPFKWGGFRLARETGAHIIPVGIVGTNRLLPAHTWDLHLNQSLTMSVGKPIDTNNYQSLEGQKQLMAVVREEISRLSSL